MNVEAKGRLWKPVGDGSARVIVKRPQAPASKGSRVQKHNDLRRVIARVIVVDLKEKDSFLFNRQQSPAQSPSENHRVFTQETPLRRVLVDVSQSPETPPPHAPAPPAPPPAARTSRPCACTTKVLKASRENSAGDLAPKRSTTSGLGQLKTTK